MNCPWMQTSLNSNLSPTYHLSVTNLSPLLWVTLGSPRTLRSHVYILKLDFFAQSSCLCTWITVLTGTYPHKNLKVNFMISGYECKFSPINELYSWVKSELTQEWSSFWGTYMCAVRTVTYIHAHKMWFIKYFIKPRLMFWKLFLTFSI
jgi:hypothetical protein